MRDQEVEQILNAGLEKVAYQEGVAEYEDSLTKVASVHNVDPRELHAFLEKVALDFSNMNIGSQGAFAGGNPTQYYDGNPNVPNKGLLEKGVGAIKNNPGKAALGAGALGAAGYGLNKLRNKDKEKTSAAEYENILMKTASAYQVDPYALHEELTKEAAQEGQGEQGRLAKLKQLAAQHPGLAAGAGALAAGGAGAGAAHFGPGALQKLKDSRLAELAATGAGKVRGGLGTAKGKIQGGLQTAADKVPGGATTLAGLGAAGAGAGAGYAGSRKAKEKEAAAYGLDADTFDYLMEEGLNALGY